jgi:hypothetical protein
MLYDMQYTQAPRSLTIDPRWRGARLAELDLLANKTCCFQEMLMTLNAGKTELAGGQCLTSVS